MTTETINSLVIAEGKESVWSYHLSQVGQTESLCGYKDVVPTSMGVDLWDSIATIHEEPCRACDVRAFGWPPPLKVVPNHPLYVACRVLDLYESWKAAASLMKDIDSGKDPLSLSAALDVIFTAVKFGPVAGIDRSGELWNMISKGAGPNLGVEEQKALRRIFTDFVLAMTKTKTCTKCHVEKPLEEFAPNKGRSDGRTSWCRACILPRTLAYQASPKGRDSSKKYRSSDRGKKVRKRSLLLRTYGLTPEDVSNILVLQNESCAVCFGRIGQNNLHIDHNHKTGQVRGLLCAKCNQGIGCLKEDSSVLRSAINYLEKERI